MEENRAELSEAGLIQEESEPPSFTLSSNSLIIREKINSINPGILETPSINFKISSSTKKNSSFKPIIDEKTRKFRKKYYSLVKDSEWNDWKWQLRNRIRSLSDLEKVINLSEDEKNAISRNINALPLAITPYYASLISKDDPTHSIRRTVIPTTSEYIKMIGEADDPLSEDHDSPVPGIVHRYPDRVLFLTTGYCSVYCRYCTRSRMVGDDCKSHVTMEQWEKGIKYIESNPEIRDVLLSGGDPLTLSNEKLNWLLSKLSRIPHVEFIRIGTKVPVVLPQRITSSLTDILKKYHPLWISIHFTHPEEITKETSAACKKLADAGIPLGSQTVLLQGINDDVETMKKLYHGLLKIRVRPYYLYQCDPITGSSHFRTPVEKGIEIISGLRGHTSGYAVPHYVIDAPDGGGKIPLLPDYFAGRDGHHVVLRNYEGNIYKYPDNVGEPVIC